MFIICFIITRFSLSNLAFAHRQVAHSFVLSIDLFHYVPHVLIFSKCWKGNNQVSFLSHSQSFVVISQILSSRLEINVYLIIDSNVFGVKIGANFLLSIVK